MTPRYLPLIALLTCCVCAEKRPLTHADYDSWRHIQNQHLSDDGHYLAYAIFPQQGDGELVVRNLITGKEWREPLGELPPPPLANFGDPNPEGPPPVRGVTVAFTHDNRTLVFSTFPAHADVEKAKRDKKKPEEMPKEGMAIMDLGSGAAVRVPGVKSFQVPTQSDGLLAYLRESDAAPSVPAADGSRPARRRVYGSDLVLRRLATKDADTKSDQIFHDATEYKLTKDGKLLAYSVSAKSEEANGVYAVPVGDGATPALLLGGRGRYTKLAFDDKQDELAFFSDRDDAAARRPAVKLYLWKRGAPAAAELVSSETPGFQKDLAISGASTITFSKDGRHVFFGCAPKPATAREPDTTPADERVSVDLWHWKDDYIQPMQKVRAQADRTRSFRAVYHLEERKMVQLADKTMSEITPSEDGRYSLGGDDREYRRMVEYDER